MMVQPDLNLFEETQLVVVVKLLVVGMLVEEPLMNKIVEQLVKAVDDTEIECCIEVEDCCSMVADQSLVHAYLLPIDISDKLAPLLLQIVHKLSIHLEFLHSHPYRIHIIDQLSKPQYDDSQEYTHRVVLGLVASGVVEVSGTTIVPYLNGKLRIVIGGRLSALAAITFSAIVYILK
ncbi:hypothetical protein Tco_0046857 [Tanacetum coccineum]